MGSKIKYRYGQAYTVANGGNRILIKAQNAQGSHTTPDGSPIQKPEQ